MYCANFELKSYLKANDLGKRISNLKENKAKRSCLIKLYDTVKFDLLHTSYFEGKESATKKKNESETTIE